jgi:MFS family permease
MLMPNSLAILGSSFSGEEKGRAIGIWAATGAIMGAVGPVLGGWLIDLGSWRAIFLINLPLAGAAILLAVGAVPANRDSGEAPLDFIGGALATLGLGGLTWALTIGSGSEGWTPPAISAAVLALAMLAVFLTIEARGGDAAMMPLALFASRSFIGLTLLTLLLYGALGALLVLIPYVLIEAAGYSGTAAGAALLPVPLVLALTSPIVGQLAGRLGLRLPLSLGSLVVGFGFLLTLTFDGTSSYWTSLLPAILVIAGGLAGVVAPLTTAVLGSVDARHIGSASGFNSAIARTGGLVATALLGSVLASHGPALLATFHRAMLACATASAVAALSAFALVSAEDHADPPEETSVSPISRGGYTRRRQRRD